MKEAPPSIMAPRKFLYQKYLSRQVCASNNKEALPCHQGDLNFDACIFALHKLYWIAAPIQEEQSQNLTDSQIISSSVETM